MAAKNLQVVQSSNTDVAKPALPRKRPQRKAAPKTQPTDIVSQVKTALDTKHRLAAFIGALLGCFVPVATFVVGHFELQGDFLQPLALLVLGGLVYSASTVYQWAKLAVGSGFKALGFTVLIEGVMVFSGVEWLSYASLAYLAMINAVATGTSLALSNLRAQKVEVAP